MRVLIIGGTGRISAAVTRLLVQRKEEVYILNRGHSPVPEGARSLVANAKDADAVRAAIGGLEFDVVTDFVAYTPQDLTRDLDLFAGRCAQYIFISTASAYQKPNRVMYITEDTPLENPFWQYSRDKIACEKILAGQTAVNYTVVRPSHTYDERAIAVSVKGNGGSYQVLKRMMEHKPVIVHGDGSCLWTLTFNTDFAVGFAGLMGNKSAYGQAYHITSDSAVSWNEVYRLAAEAAGGEYIPCYVPSEVLARSAAYDFRGSLLGDKANYALFDNSKIKAAVPEFNAKISYAEGVRMAVENISANENLRKTDNDFDAWSDRLVKEYGGIQLGSWF